MSALLRFTPNELTIARNKLEGQSLLAALQDPSHPYWPDSLAVGVWLQEKRHGSTTKLEEYRARSTEELLDAIDLGDDDEDTDDDELEEGTVAVDPASSS